MFLKICLLLATFLISNTFEQYALQHNVESAFNSQILIEYEAFYVYESMAVHFSRPDIALHGFAKFFQHAANEELEHARKLSEFVNKRNGRVTLQHIMLSADVPPMPYKSINEAINLAIEKELFVTKKLNTLHSTSQKDPQAQDLLDEFLKEQVESVSSLQALKTRINLCDSSIFLVDQELRSSDEHTPHSGN